MYGTDKPDLRNPLIIRDATEVLKETTFGPFKKSTIKVIVVDDIGDKPNSWFNEIVDYASSIGMPGIGYLTMMDDGTFKGPIDKFLSDSERENLISKFEMKTNSVIFFIANKNVRIAQNNGKIAVLKSTRKANLKNLARNRAFNPSINKSVKTLKIFAAA